MRLSPALIASVGVLLGSTDTTSQEKVSTSFAPEMIRTKIAEEVKAIVIRQLEADGNWNVTESPNFRVRHQLSKEKSEEICRAIEKIRIDVQKKWMKNADSWDQKCDVSVYQDGKQMEWNTGKNAYYPGFSEIESAPGGRVISRKIALRSDAHNIFTHVMPHEVAHVTIAGSPGKMIPRWADEGIAILSEPRSSLDDFQKNLHQLQKHQLFSLQELLTMDYPELKSFGTFYAQSASLTNYLQKRKDPPAVLAFIRDGMNDAAALKNFGATSLQDLEADWRRKMFGKE